MLNAEKYKKEILDITKGRHRFAVSKDKQNIVRSCVGIRCETCIFNDNKYGCYGCDFLRTKWLLSEYKEPIKLTRLEFEILKWLDKGGYKFIVRSPSDNLMTHDSIPKKALNGWISENRYKTLTSFNDLLHFIKYEDEEPTSIKQVLKNCEVIEDDDEKR